MSHAGEGETGRLQDLLAYLRESLEIELKSWLDLSDPEHAAGLAKAILALANHWGGCVLLGLSQDSGEWRPATGRPQDLSRLDHDRADGIVRRYAGPAGAGSGSDSACC